MLFCHRKCSSFSFLPIQTQTRHGIVRQGECACSEGDLQWLLPECSQEGPPGGVPYSGRQPGGIHSPVECTVQPPAGVGGVPRAGPDHQGVHARGHHNRPQVAGRVRTCLLQVLRSHQAEQTEETGEAGTAL